jgi:hypothetical protein
MAVADDDKARHEIILPPGRFFTRFFFSSGIDSAFILPV